MENQLSLFYGLSFLTAALAFAFAAYLYLWVKRQPVVNPTIGQVAQLIKEGANTFMRREYRILAKFALVIAVIIFLLLTRKKEDPDDEDEDEAEDEDEELSEEANKLINQLLAEEKPSASEKKDQ